MCGSLAAALLALHDVYPLTAPTSTLITTLRVRRKQNNTDNPVLISSSSFFTEVVEVTDRDRSCSQSSLPCMWISLEATAISFRLMDETSWIAQQRVCANLKD